MVSKVQVIKLCNVEYEDENEEIEAVSSFSFGVDGVQFEIDACKEHAEVLEQARTLIVTYGHGERPSGSRRTTLLDGRNTHAGTTAENANYICSECGKPYKNHSYYEAHMRAHKGGKPPVPCNVSGCSNSYWSTQALGAHKWRIHRIAGESKEAIRKREKQLTTD